MPVYDYVCRSCGRRVGLVMSFAEYDRATPACPHCAGTDLKRRLGRVAIARSEGARLDSLLDDPSLDSLEDDPRAMGAVMRRMSRELGEEGEGGLDEEFNEVVARLESGESPADIEERLGIKE